MKPKGTLKIVGVGIQLETQLTQGAKSYIEKADKVLFALSDKVMILWLKSFAPEAESLPAYYPDKTRTESYQRMIKKILEEVRKEQSVCVVYYGHPGVFAFVPHEAIRQAHMEGFEAQMLPGISAEDCLFADLGLDPANFGCQSFEATDFLIRRRLFDPRCSLILWQINVIGHLQAPPKETVQQGLAVLVEELCHHYEKTHEVVIYRASNIAFLSPVILRIPLEALSTTTLPSLATLYIPPKEEAPLDSEMIKRLGMLPNTIRTPQKPSYLFTNQKAPTL